MAATTLNARCDSARIESLPISSANHRCILALDRGQCSGWAEANKIPYQGVPVGTIKRHTAGKGNADKQAVIDAVRRIGFQPADDNEADALALLDWTIAHGVGVVR